MSDTNTEIPTKFQARLAAIGDDAAAGLLGHPKRTIQSWRRGERMPRPAQARRIAQSLGLSLDDIYRERAA